MKKLLALILSLLLLPSCTPQGQETAPFAPEESQKLTVYTSHKEEVWWPVVKEFEERYDLWVEVVEGGTNELLDQISKESDSPVADVMFGGSVENLASYAANFEPYTTSSDLLLDPQFTSETSLWTPFSALPIVLIYNPKLISEDQLNGWESLLSPQLKGQIAFADPAVSGSSFTALMTLFQALAIKGSEEELSKKFAENLDGKQLTGSGEVVPAVAEGEFMVGVTLEETALKAIAAGQNISLLYPNQGTSAVPDAGALVKGAPHRENAQLFLDFIAGRDAQTLLVDRFSRRSVRQDVSAPALTPLSEITLINYDVARAAARHDAVLMTWAFYLDGGDGS